MAWQVGDLAVCIDASRPAFSPYSNGGLVEGRVYTVIAVDTAPGDLDSDPCGLLFAELPPPEPFEAFGCGRFRKVQHDKREACEAEFSILLKLSKKRANA